MDVKWIKVSTSMFETNRKIKHIEKMPNGDTILIIWLKLLLLAGNVNDHGAIYITPEVPYTVEALADELRRDVDVVKTALELFETFGMIEIVDGVYYLSAWEKYQSTDKLAEMREKNRERQKKWYDKHKALPNVKPNVRSNEDITLPNAIEEEREEDKEKEFHSFTPADKKAALERMGGKLGQGVVMISEEQFNDLLDKLSLDELEKYMGIVAECELKGKRYKNKSHYQAILDMVAKDRRIAQ